MLKNKPLHKIFYLVCFWSCESHQNFFILKLQARLDKLKLLHWSYYLQHISLRPLLQRLHFSFFYYFPFYAISVPFAYMILHLNKISFLKRMVLGWYILCITSLQYHYSYKNLACIAIIESCIDNYPMNNEQQISLGFFS